MNLLVGTNSFDNLKIGGTLYRTKLLTLQSEIDLACSANGQIFNWTFDSLDGGIFAFATFSTKGF